MRAHGSPSLCEPTNPGWGTEEREGGRDEDGEDGEGNMAGEGEKKYLRTVVRAT